MSTNHMRCPICKKPPTEPVNLKCDHHPCFACIQPHVSIDPQRYPPPHSAKWKPSIVSPALPATARPSSTISGISYSRIPRMRMRSCS